MDKTKGTENCNLSNIENTDVGLHVGLTGAQVDLFFTSDGVWSAWISHTESVVARKGA